MNKFIRYLKSILRIWDYIDYETADNSIRKNISFKGPNVIILACAIVIASVGLNVNSIPVIIGAMLISPVMGPILGLGLGIGTEDNRLLKDSLKNFATMVTISILASALFFILSPLTMENPSELLARTKPTIYDVLIALFGGFAGILETSRKEKGTVISGVAIATALMPPLCTVGYGISELNFTYIGGALYLFLINTVFIALATFMAVKFFRFPAVNVADENHQRLSKKWYIVILFIIIAPSIYTAVSVIRENNFKINASNFVQGHKHIGKSFVYDHKVSYSRKNQSIDIFVAGEMLSDDSKERLYDEAEKYGIMRSQIKLHEDATVKREDISETEILKGIYEYNDKQIERLTDSIMILNKCLDSYKDKELPAMAVSKELFAQYPSITNVSITRGYSVNSETGNKEERVMAFITCDSVSDNMSSQIERWLKVRLGNENVVVVF